MGSVHGSAGNFHLRPLQDWLIPAVESVDLEVLAGAEGWLAEGHKVLLITVVRTWGSSPRPEGSLLALRDDGHVTGSVSGGCIEDDLIAKVRRAGITLSRCEVLTYGISAAEAHRFGLPCGGTLQLVAEPLSSASQVPMLLAALRSGRLMERRLDLVTGKVDLRGATSCGKLRYDGTELVTYHGPRFRLLLIGAGPVARFLSQIALGLEFEVMVCDPREEYRDGWQVPDVKVLRTMPDDAVLEMNIDERCAVVALTHDPKLDDLALLEALKSKAFYVGALGSRRNDSARRARLAEHFDMSEAELGRLHGPVGLAIGSRTPGEIAVSIAAEIVAVRNGVDLQLNARPPLTARFCPVM
jgi:xanthine dehydrogenase accessory factor